MKMTFLKADFCISHGAKEYMLRWERSNSVEKAWDCSLFIKSEQTHLYDYVETRSAGFAAPNMSNSIMMLTVFTSSKTA
jgi:hypothetical protein